MKTSRGRLGWRHCIEALERRVLFASMYNIIDLGAGTVPSAINGAGQIVGEYNDNGISGVYSHAFVYTNGAFTDLGQQLGPQLDSDAVGISESGHVVGHVMLTPGSDVPSGFFYNGSSFVTYGVPGADYTTFSSVNNSDQIVGTTASGGGAGQAIYSVAGATPTLLSATVPALGDVSTGKAINNAGQMVGEYFPSSNGGFVDHGYLIQGTTLTDLPGPADAISQNGMIVGSGLVDQSSTNNIGTAYLDHNGTLTNLGYLNGTATYATGVNDSGQVVGTSSNSRGWLYSNGVLTDLASLIPANSGWVLTNPVGINDQGQIIGYGNLNGAEHGFLLSGGLQIQITHQTPVPDQARPGDTIHYTITAQAMPNTVQQVTLDDMIPAGTTLVAGSITGGGVAQGGAIDWSTGNSPNISVSFDVKVNSPNLLPANYTQVVDNATGEATFPGGQTSDASAQDVIPFEAQNGQITASGTIFHGFATLSLPQLQRTIATFTDSDPTLGVGSFSARINWGDKSVTGAAIAADPAGGFDVISDHQYARPGDYSVTVSIKGPKKSSATAGSQGEIQQPLEVNSTASNSVSDLLPQKSGWTGKQLPNGDLEVTLYSAIQAANADGRGTITFAIDPAQNGGSAVIAPANFDVTNTGELETFPSITVPVTIDGTTQPGGRVEIDGELTRNYDPAALGNTYHDGLVVNGGFSTIKGLDIYGFTGWGLVLRGRGGNHVSNNYIGTDITGESQEGNGLETIDYFSPYPQTPGTDVGGGLLIDNSPKNSISSNVISGNLAAQVTRDNGSGTYSASTLSGQYGVQMELSGASATDNVITGNAIGADANRISPVGGQYGLELLNAPKNTIGGKTQSAGNLFTNDVDLELSGAGTSANVIQNNDIGHLPTPGSIFPVPFGFNGVNIENGAGGNTIGGKSTLGNYINVQQYGAFIEGDANVVQGNVIAGAGRAGVYVSGANNVIGGIPGGAGNQIFGNGDSTGTGSAGAGVIVDPVSATGGADDDNSILGNSIYNTAMLGIDLGGDGVTPNDSSLTGRSGPNNLRNYPVLTSAKVNGTRITITGTLDSIPLKTYRVEFFVSGSANASGFGDGQAFLGAKSIRLGLTGVANFSVTFALPAAVPAGAVTATATDPAGNTSEFSKAVVPS